MNEANVPRLLCVTSTGVIHNRTAPLFYKVLVQPLLRYKIRGHEMHGRVSGAEPFQWTIVRPFRLTNGPRTGTYRIITDSDLENAGSIARADVADLLLRSVESYLHVGQKVAVQNLLSTWNLALQVYVNLPNGDRLRERVGNWITSLSRRAIRYVCNT